MISWLVGNRSPEAAHYFMRDLADRMTNRIQVTTDGHAMYRSALLAAFGYEVDYAQIVKSHGQPPGSDRRRYSPPVCNGAKKVHMIGRPDMDKVSTSYVERSNLNLRMRQRRFTRLTNAFSKKVENHAHAVSLHFFAYNFIQPHGTLTKRNGGTKTTPAMAVGVTDRVWRGRGHP